MWEKWVPLMLNIFKIFLYFQRIFYHLSAGKWFWLGFTLLFTTHVPWHYIVYTYMRRSVDILTNHTYLHLKQSEIPLSSGFFKWFSDFLHANIIKTHSFSVLCLCKRHWCIKKALRCYSMFIYDYFPLGNWGTASLMMHWDVWYPQLFWGFSS